MPGIAIAITVLIAALSAWVGARLLAGGAWGRQPGVDETSRNLRKVHSNPTPRVGGIAVAGGLIWGLLSAGVWQGQMTLGVLQNNGREGLVVVARDSGPGISDIPRAMQMGYSTSGSLGLGLPGVKRLMDDFEIVSKTGRGTTVTATKWKR